MTPLNSSVDISSCLSYASKRTTLTCVSEMRHRPPPRHSCIRHYAGGIVMGFTFGTFLLEWAFLSFLSHPHQKSKERERDFYTFSPSLFLLHSQVSISLFSPIFFFPFLYSKLSFVLKLDLVEQSSLFFAHFQARYFFFSFHVVVIVHCAMGKKSWNCKFCGMSHLSYISVSKSVKYGELHLINIQFLFHIFPKHILAYHAIDNKNYLYS